VAALSQSFESVPISAVHPHPDNPRRGDTAMITESIAANGFFGACVVQRSTGHILIGNHRWQAAEQAGEDTVPVLWVDVDDDRALRIMVADNRTAELAAWDNDTLLTLLHELGEDPEGLLGTGFTEADLENLLARFGPADTLDELLDEHGDPRPEQLWPVLRISLPPDAMQRWKSLRDRLDTDEAAVLIHLLDQSDARKVSPLG
jgi:ParB-like chromosome segregation protein Spo0J